MNKKQRFAFSTYLVVSAGICFSLFFGIILYMYNSISEGKNTLQGVKASDYVSKIEISANSIRFFDKDMLAEIVSGKKANTDDLELELSAFSESILGLAGEGRQNTLIITESDKLVQLNEALNEKVNKLLDLNKSNTDAQLIKNQIELIESSIVEISSIAVKIKEILMTSFTEGFQKIILQELRMKQVIFWGSLVTLVVFFTAAFIIRKSIKILTTSNIQLGEASELVHESSQKVSTSSVQLSDLVNEQSAAVHQTASALDQITAMIEQNVSSMNQLVNSAESSFQSTQEGLKAVETVKNSIETIQDVNQEMQNEVEQNNKKINAINDIIVTISQKTQVINDIVFQTKLLSFNASVEAARAGEQGKGFAVVAEEVGNLATMSGNAAKEISDILASAIEEVSNITTNSSKSFEAIIEKSQKCIDQGVESTTACKSVMDSIANEVKNSKDQVVSLQLATKEQNSGIQNIKSAMQELQISTDQVSILSSSSAQLSTLMDNNYQNLKSAIIELDSVVHGEVNH